MIKTLAVAMLISAAGGIKISYVPFASTVYPYTIQQPSSYRHIVYPDSSGRKIDYFAPGLGSFVTNVNIYATDGSLRNQVKDMRQSGARAIHVSGHLVIAGKRRNLVCGDWHGIAGQWREEQIQFTSGGLVWHITMSYDLHYQSVRSVMLRMIRSFRVR